MTMKETDAAIRPPSALEHLAVLLVDAQSFYLNGIDPYDRQVLINNMRHVLDYCIQNDVPVAVTEHSMGDKTDKSLMDLVKLATSKVFTKFTVDAFKTTDLDTYLREMDVKTLFLMGLWSSECVAATARGARFLGYTTITDADVTVARDPGYHQTAIKRFKTVGRVIPFRELFPLEEPIYSRIYPLERSHGTSVGSQQSRRPSSS